MRKSKPTPEELIHHHQVTGDFEDAIACYESMGHELNSTLELQSGLLKCYLEMNRPHTAAMLVKGMMKRAPFHRTDLIKYQIESAWNLGRWEEIDEVQSSESENFDVQDWSTSLARILLLCHKNEPVHERIAALRKALMLPIAAAAMEQGTYRRSYEYLVKLQILDEIESWSTVKSMEDLYKLFKVWKTRQTFSQCSLSNLEPVLKVRRALLNVSMSKAQEEGLDVRHLKRELGDNWLMSAKIARKADQFNKAYNLLLEAENHNNKDVFIERAKLSWARATPDEAITTLENGIRDQYPALVEIKKETVASFDKEDLDTCGQGKLMLARYVDEAANLDPNNCALLYNDAKILLKQNEDVHYFSARFFDKTIGKNYEAADLDAKGDIIAHIITQYCRSLTFGCEHLHQSLARLLSLWLDYGSRVFIARENQTRRTKKKYMEDMQKAFKKMNEIIERFVNTSPSYYFLSVFPQLTSRICDEHPEVWRLLKVIIIKTFMSYPTHVFWHMVALSKSSYTQRAQRAREILDYVKSKLDPKLIEDGLNLADKLIKLCDEKLSVGDVELNQVFPTLPKLITTRGFSKLMLPTTTNMMVSLPTGSLTNREHNPFPSELVYIAGIENNLTVMYENYKVTL